MYRHLDQHHLEDLAVGAVILGTGGGGDPFVGKVMAQQAIEEEGPVKLLDPGNSKMTRWFFPRR